MEWWVDPESRHWESRVEDSRWIRDSAEGMKLLLLQLQLQLPDMAGFWGEEVAVLG
jgi:hypothetical protein